MCRAEVTVAARAGLLVKPPAPGHRPGFPQ